MRLIAIHGFGGCNQDWSEIGERLSKDHSIHFLALPGHSEHPSCGRLGISNPHDLARLWAQKLESRYGQDFCLMGYSMGARIATLMTQYISFRKLILLSGSMGIKGHLQRLERQKQDKIWADRLRSAPEDFWHQWYQQPIFASFCQNPQRLAQVIEQKGQHNPERLAESLEILGQGKHEELIPVLKQAAQERKIASLLYIAGESDKKYQSFSDELRIALCGLVRARTAPGAGHLLLKEAPQFCADSINMFLGE